MRNQVLVIFICEVWNLISAQTRVQGYFINSYFNKLNKLLYTFKPVENFDVLSMYSILLFHLISPFLP